MQTVAFSDFTVFHEVLKSIPNNYQLQLSNSSAIRYAQLFTIHPTLKVFCNRGTSGIDGSTSTAIGASLIHNAPTVFITGDLSFLYDSNALWNNYLRSDFRMIVVNNQGGGIFNLLPISKGPEAESYFNLLTTPHQTPLHKVIASLGLPVKVAVTKEDYQRELDEWTKNPKLTFLEVQFNDLANQDVYNNLKTVRI